MNIAQTNDTPVRVGTVTAETLDSEKTPDLARNTEMG
jgi:hypothetical protein